MPENTTTVAPETEAAPSSLADIIADLRGFGIEEFEEILTLNMGGKQMRIKISNVPTEQELTAMLAVSEIKGYAHIQMIKVEFISRAITWINGIDLKRLTGKNRLVIDPRDGLSKDFQIVLRDTINGWGVEIVQVLWKVILNHSQTIENRLFSQFPDAAVLTDVERRYRDRIEKEIEEVTKSAIRDKVMEVVGTDDDEDAVPS